MEILNGEIVRKLNQIQIDINFIKESIEEKELTSWARNELNASRKEDESESTSIEEL